MNDSYVECGQCKYQREQCRKGIFRIIYGIGGAVLVVALFLFNNQSDLSKEVSNEIAGVQKEISDFRVEQAERTTRIETIVDYMGEKIDKFIDGHKK